MFHLLSMHRNTQMLPGGADIACCYTSLKLSLLKADGLAATLADGDCSFNTAHINISYVTSPLPPFHLPSSIESYKLSPLRWNPQASAAILLGSAHQFASACNQCAMQECQQPCYLMEGLDSTLLRAQTHLAPHFNTKILPAS